MSIITRAHDVISEIFLSLSSTEIFLTFLAWHRGWTAVTTENLSTYTVALCFNSHHKPRWKKGPQVARGNLTSNLVRRKFQLQLKWRRKEKTRRRAKASDDHEAGARIFRACAVENVKGEKDFSPHLSVESGRRRRHRRRQRKSLAPRQVDFVSLAIPCEDVSLRQQKTKVSPRGHLG